MVGNIIIFFVLPLSSVQNIPSTPQQAPLKTVTFWDFGYNETTTFLCGDTLLLYLEARKAAPPLDNNL
jgi:hypothetical protein